jgi:L-rhamnose mutarotase
MSVSLRLAPLGNQITKMTASDLQSDSVEFVIKRIDEEFDNFTNKILMKRYCLALDLKDDPKLIGEYENFHRAVWKEIVESIRNAGIEAMNIYRTGNRLFMIMEVNDSFSFEKKSMSDASNPTVQQWESLMWTFQQSLPWAGKDEKWVLMNEIFELK